MQMKAPSRELKIGTIIDKTLAVVERSAMPALLYVLALTIISGAGTYLVAGSAAPMRQLSMELLKFVVGVVLAYLLIETMVRKTGLRTRQSQEVFLAYFGLSVVYALGVAVGLILVILPGLLIWARWSIAQATLVARGEGVMRALGESWERTRGNEFSILVAALALLILPIAILIAVSVLFEPTDVIGIALSQLASSALSVLSLAEGVALYGLIVSRESPQVLPTEGPPVGA